MTANATKFMTGNEIREMFLRFFESKGHRRVRSSPLVPHGDPTLLFTNAGMNQFKDVFLGLEKRDYSTATTAQKCVRAGGKHNDLENVGFTKRHHTFFEMLGNFSFGDYFKEKAIPYAWELVTSPEWFGISKDKLYVTIFGGAEIPAPSSLTGHSERSEESFFSGDSAQPPHVGAQHAAPHSPPTSAASRHSERNPYPSGAIVLGVDEDARKLWLKENVPAERVVPVPGLKDNFWAMGDTGPCGPCSEIFYDMGVEASELGHGTTAPECKFPCDCGRYVEIWNLVFMQFNRDASGTLTPLPKPCVDTGMGLERTACVLQGVISNYDTDLFVPLMKRAAELCASAVGAQHAAPLLGTDSRSDEGLQEGKGGAASLRVIADHARATTFLIADGVLPSNEGRGYVLRKIIRRAIRHGRLLGANEPFLGEMVGSVQKLMSTAYHELTDSAVANARNIVVSEERRFASTLALGLSKLDQKVSGMVFTGVPQPNLAWLIGSEAFYLYETFGLPFDFTLGAVRDRGIALEESETEAAFDQAMEEQRTRARASWKGASKETASPAYAKIAETFQTEKDFYQATSAKDCRVEAIILTGSPSRPDAKGGPVNALIAGESGEVVLDRTIIYAESGGQVADTGAFYDASESQHLAEVTGAYYPVAGLIAHKVVAKETLRVGDRVTVIADADRRARIIRNHTGTHLVHAALRNILGTHVKQAGSLNAPDRLRFDFSHFAHVDPEELHDIEQQVNDEIRHNTQVETNISTLDDALASGALAFFGDKYPESNVRVVTILDDRAPRGFYSKELCGGTHVQRIGDIGVLKIVSEGSVAAGVRRIEAVTGIGALEHYEQQAKVLSQVASQLNVGEDAVLASVEKLANTVKTLEKELESQKRMGALGQLDQLASQVQTIKGVKVVAAEVAGTDREGLRQLVDSLRQKIGSGVVALGMPEDGKVALIAGVTKDLTAKVHAGKLIQAVAKLVGGSGGGRPDLAEAGGKDTAALKSALGTIPAYLEPLL